VAFVDVDSYYDCRLFCQQKGVDDGNQKKETLSSREKGGVGTIANFGFKFFSVV
jgi:hypothetical protein